MSGIDTQPYKGARDMYPRDMGLLKYLFDKWRHVAESFGYEEYTAPMLELSEIYKSKTSDEIVNNQTYTFVDRGGREVTIRPEMTPSLARMVAAQRQELAYPLRLYSIPNVWRYERPQKGRLREHWQLNVDLFGVETIDGELEIIAIADEIMKALGASRSMYVIKLNSRKFTNIIMVQYLGLDGTQSVQMTNLLDKRQKMPEEAFLEQAKQIFGDFDQSRISKLDSLLKANSMADLPDNLKKSPVIKEIQNLFTLLRDNYISNAVFDVGLMRGFDYYTDIVFEVFDTHPDNQRSLFGGGRYDNLVGAFGAEPVATIGFGAGDVTFMEFLNVHQLQPDYRSVIDVYVIVVGENIRQAQGIAAILRDSGCKIALDISGDKVDKQLRSAIKKSIPFAMFVGEAELQSERFNLKELQTQKEEILSLEQIAQKVLDYRLSDK